jgi:hypothetical protein
MGLMMTTNDSDRAGHTRRKVLECMTWEGKDMRTRGENEFVAVPRGKGSAGCGRPGIRISLSHWSDSPLLDPIWVLVGVTGPHP